jgi:hypothetical protein
MENLTLSEINQLIVEAGGAVVAETAEFRQINASGEASYRITYPGSSTVMQMNSEGSMEEITSDTTTNTIFVTAKEDGGFRASINSLL